MSTVTNEKPDICDLNWGSPTTTTNPLQTTSCFNIVKSDLLKTALFIKIDTICCKHNKVVVQKQKTL